MNPTDLAEAGTLRAWWDQGGQGAAVTSLTQARTSAAALSLTLTLSLSHSSLVLSLALSLSLSLSSQASLSHFLSSPEWRM